MKNSARIISILIILVVISFIVLGSDFANDVSKTTFDLNSDLSHDDNYPLVIPEGKEWMDISSFASCKRPWISKGVSFTEFWRNNDIKFQAVSSQGNPQSCDDCDCAQNYQFEVLVDSSDKDKVLKIIEQYK